MGMGKKCVLRTNLYRTERSYSHSPSAHPYDLEVPFFCCHTLEHVVPSLLLSFFIFCHMVEENVRNTYKWQLSKFIFDETHVASTMLSASIPQIHIDGEIYKIYKNGTRTTCGIKFSHSVQYGSALWLAITKFQSKCHAALFCN